MKVPREDLCDGLACCLGMPAQLETFIPGRPQAASRPKVSTHGGARAYYPKAHVRYEALCVAHLVREWRRRDPMVGPVSLELVAVFERPKNRTPRSEGGALSMTGCLELAVTCDTESVVGSLPAFSEPQDVDNLAKMLMDALQKAKVYRNDSRVVSCSVSKLWAPVGSERCGMHVVVRGRRS